MTGLVLGQGDSEGWTMCNSATEKSGDHGVVSAQIANISIISSGITTAGITQLTDAQNVAINAIISALTNKGTVAAS